MPERPTWARGLERFLLNWRLMRSAHRSHKVSVVMGDTAVVPFDLQTSASRSTVFMGNAIVRACEDIHEQLREMAADLFGFAEG